MSTATPRNGFEKIAQGSDVDTWGVVWDGTFGLIDQSLDGVLSLAVSGGTVTLTADPYVDNQARNRVLVLTGAPGSPVSLHVPAVQKWYWLVNQTTGGQPLTVTTGLGSSVSLPATGAIALFCDGTNVLPLSTVASSTVTETVTHVASSRAVSTGDFGTALICAAGVQLTLPLSSVGSGRWVDVKNGAASGSVTVIVTSPDHIDGGTTLTLPALGSARILSSGTDWTLTFDNGGVLT